MRKRDRPIERGRVRSSLDETAMRETIDPWERQVGTASPAKSRRIHRRNGGRERRRVEIGGRTCQVGPRKASSLQAERRPW